MSSYTLRFVNYLLGFQGATTSDTEAELEFLASLAKGKNCIVEVGVYEGVASKIFCQNMDYKGKLYLVDPYFSELKIEKVFNTSFTQFIAKQCVKDYSDLVQFVKLTSLEASKSLSLKGKADLIFIDARHDYESVLEDFQCWAPMLSNEGIMAFHDSRVCEARQDLNEQVGPVRLCNEIPRGEHGDWKVVNAMDSITVISAASS